MTKPKETASDDFAERIFERFVKASGFQGAWWWSTAEKEKPMAVEKQEQTDDVPFCKHRRRRRMQNDKSHARQDQ